MSKMLQLAAASISFMITATSAYAVTTCTISSKWQCETEGGCARVKNAIVIRIDDESQTYSRCDSKGCDDFPASFSTSGIYFVIDVPGKGMFAKLSVDGSEFVEVVSLQTVVTVSHGMTAVPPREFYETIVLPNLEDFERDFGDKRRAFNAVHAVDSLAAHLYFWCRANRPAEIVAISGDSAYRKHLADRNSNYALVRDIAKAQKHVKLVQGAPQISSAGAVHVASLGWDEGRLDEMRWDGPPQVVVVTNDSQTRAVDGVTKAAAIFLEAEMTRLGI